jgi:LemA protein
MNSTLGFFYYMEFLMKSSLLVIVFSFLLVSCGLQSIPQANNAVEGAWAEVMNQYKTRSDKIPQLVEVVKGAANYEKSTLEAVISARAKATAINVDAKSLNPETLKKYQEAQGQLGQALGRLMVVSERYPELKANQNFLGLQAQIEGVENRINIARRRYIETVQEFNNLITVFPTSLTNSLVHHLDKKPQFTATEAEQKTPEVKF